MNVRNVIEKKNLFNLMQGFNCIKYLQKISDNTSI